MTTLSAVFILAISFGFVECQIKIDPEHLQHICYIGRNGTELPEKDENITGICSPWKDDTCCTNETSSSIEKMYNGNYCAKKMSSKCKSFFHKMNCFKECSPYLGPWAMSDKNKTSFQFVPLCQSECSNWWDACKDEPTCFNNSNYEFEWESGAVSCTSASKCRSIKELYKDETYFCENVFGASIFLVVDENRRPCMNVFESLTEDHFASMFFAQTIRDKGWNELYHTFYDLSILRNSLPPMGSNPSKSEQEGNRELKYIMLSFFSGALVTILGTFVGCFILSKWRSIQKNNTSSGGSYNRMEEDPEPDSAM